MRGVREDVRVDAPVRGGHHRAEQRCLRVVMALENNPYPQDVRVRNEAEALSAAGHAVVVLAPRARSQSSRELVRGVRVKRFRLPEGRGRTGIAIEYAVAFAQLTARVALELLRGADVVHMHNPPDFLFPVAGLARVMGRGVVYDHHDLAPELFEQKFGGGWPVALLRWCERMTMRGADIVVAANDSHRATATARGGVEQDRVVVVRNAPRTRTLATAPTTRPGSLRDPRLCYVGALGTQDGVALLPDIVERMARSGYAPTLTIAGDGPERSTIASEARRRGVAECIELLGRVPYERVPEVIENADICLDVAPGTPLNHKSTMVKVGEYLAGGRPIVSFALEETRITAGDCALYAPCDDVDELCRLVLLLCEREDLRATLSARSLARARQGTWEHSVARLEHAYDLVGGVLAHA